jgi:NAD(P)-dependent dehydrogenase (short-subunit alcohol dehydrogenase family)
MAGHGSGAVVITGASTGIGRATALLLDQQGYRVFAGVRKDEDAKSLKAEASDQLKPIKIDVTKERSIAAAKRNVKRALGDEGLVGLVNNAGIGGGGPIEFTALDHLRETLEVNVIGQVAVTQAFLPLVRRAKGTIVFIASIGGRVGTPFLSPYNISKFGIEALGESLRHEIEPWEIDVVVVEPGAIVTKIWDKAEELSEQQLAEMPAEAQRLYGPQMVTFFESFIEAGRKGIPPEKVARVIHGAISSENPKPRRLVGRDAKIGARLKGTVPERTFHRLVKGQFKLPTDVPPE